ncbi:MAG: acyl carrier protein [OM182 bacterium]|jgi:methoxymalonate biosynthesis acyl carrier protein|nr:acyl carrier protein [OM182 bacterium]
MSTQTYQTEIREFLETFIAEDDFEDSDDIFEMGLVSSLMAMQLVLFVEKRLDTKLDGADLDFANFRTIDRIATLMQAKAV